MDIQQVLSGSLANIDKTRPVEQLKSDQIYPATVLKVQAISPDKTLIRVQLQGQALQLISPQALELTPGQSLQLQVIAKKPVLMVKLLVDNPATTKSNTSFQPALAQKELVLKQWAPEKTVTQSESSPALTLKDLSRLSSPLLFRLTVTNRTEKKIEGEVILLDKKNAAFLDKVHLKLNRQQIQSSDQQALKTSRSLLLRFDPQKPDRIQAVAVKSMVALNQAVQQALRTHLPQQQPSPVLLESLSKYINPISQQSSVPEALKNIARELLTNLPTSSGLTQTPQLKQAIEQSGLFLESRLLGQDENMQPGLKNDFKARVLRLIDHLARQLDSDKADKLPDATRQLFRQLQQKASQALARIVVDQLQSLPKDDGAKTVWLLEIPFLNQGKPDKVRLEIEQQNDRRDQADEGRHWSVNITVTPPGLGTIYCKILSVNQVVSTRFWSESVTTTEKISRFLDVLKQQLEDKGLTTGTMTAEQGKPEPQALHSSHQLVNEKA